MIGQSTWERVPLGPAVGSCRSQSPRPRAGHEAIRNMCVPRLVEP